MAKQAHRGRPTAIRKSGQRSTLSLRVTAELFEQLDADAKAKGRPLSHEAESRLEQSYLAQAMVEVGPEIAFGRRGADLLMLLGRLIRHAPGVRGLAVEDDWIGDPIAFRIAEVEVNHALALLRPTGDPLPESVERAAKDRVERLLVAGGKIEPPAEWREDIR